MRTRKIWRALCEMEKMGRAEFVQGAHKDLYSTQLAKARTSTIDFLESLSKPFVLEELTPGDYLLFSPLALDSEISVTTKYDVKSKWLAGAKPVLTCVPVERDPGKNSITFGDSYPASQIPERYRIMRLI